MCFRLERSEGSISLLSCSPGGLVHSKHTVGTNKYLCWVDASGANLVLLQSLFKTLSMFSFLFFIIWGFFAPIVKFFLYVSQVTPRGEAGPRREFSKWLLNEQKIPKIFCKRLKRLTLGSFQKEKERKRGGERKNVCLHPLMLLSAIWKCPPQGGPVDHTGVH